MFQVLWKYHNTWCQWQAIITHWFRKVAPHTVVRTTSAFKIWRLKVGCLTFKNPQPKTGHGSLTKRASQWYVLYSIKNMKKKMKMPLDCPFWGQEKWLDQHFMAVCAAKNLGSRTLFLYFFLSNLVPFLTKRLYKNWVPGELDLGQKGVRCL